MKHLFKRITSGIAIGGAVLLLVGVVCFSFGARINTTRSIPLGLYWTSNKSVEKGDYVFFCPPPRGVFDMAKERGYITGGFCRGDYGYMMKRVLAVKDDIVTVADEGVYVNGKLLPFSAVRKADKSGRPLPRFQANHYVLGDYELLLMTDVNPLSFDSRYFGPVNHSQIKAVIVPVLTW